MDERQKVLDALTEVRDDVDFENETELVDDGVIDSLDLTQMPRWMKLSGFIFPPER